MNTRGAWRAEQQELLEDISVEEVCANPFLFISRLSWTKWLTRIDLFRQVLNIPGAVVECGVRDGASLMSYFQMSAILEPSNINRSIVGFDTFEGFPSVSDKDPGGASEGDERGIISSRRLSQWAEFQNSQRMVDFVHQVELVEGDACVTIPKYVDAHPELGIALLVLDFDLYEPTKIALEQLLPLVPRGGIVVFDEFLNRRWPGETLAFKELRGLSEVRLEKFQYDAHTIFFRVE